MTAFIPPVSKLSSTVIRILGCNPGRMTLQGTNTYIIGSGKRRILLDTGEGNNLQYVANLKSVLRNEDIQLEHIIITHWHHDHIGGVQDVVENLAPDCHIWKLQRPDKVEDPLPNNISMNYLPNCSEMKTEGASLSIIHTPGHTTDHAVVYHKEENIIFSGDCILGEGTAVFEDLHDYMTSLYRILDLNPKVIYPGHGPVIEDPLPKIQYYIDHRNKREKQIVDILMANPDRTFTEMDLVEMMYKDTPKELYMAASINVNHHLKKLHKEKKVVNIGSDWQINNQPQSCL